jgi:hypothetical protein
MKTLAMKWNHYWHRVKRNLPEDAAVIVIGQIIMLSVICLAGLKLKSDMMNQPVAPQSAEAIEARIDELVFKSITEMYRDMCGQRPFHEFCTRVPAETREFFDRELASNRK